MLLGIPRRVNYTIHGDFSLAAWRRRRDEHISIVALTSPPFLYQIHLSIIIIPVLNAARSLKILFLLGELHYCALKLK